MDIINLEDKNLYYVGGFVRDKLLGIESRDTDMVYEGMLEGVNEFGTVRPEGTDIALMRCETYPKPGHLPVITKFGCSVEEDAQRRDFTVNALYMRVAGGEIIDPTGKGLDDLKNKKLRVLHDKSFIDDPTRIIRGLKFAVRLGFELDEHTKALRDEYLANVNYDMCYKRIKDELKDMLTSREAFEKFINEGIYKLVTPNEVELPAVNIEEILRRYAPRNDAEMWLVYAGVLRDLSRLELTRAEQKVLDCFHAAKKLNPVTDFEIYKAFECAPVESVLLYALLKDEKIARHYLEDLRHIRLEINGDDLSRLGLAPSPHYSGIFDHVLRAKLQNPALTKQEELGLVRDFQQSL